MNLLILCTFKYFNFFGDNLCRLFQFFGIGLDWVTIDILLPVGISFYTFQALSYTIDVYRQKIEPTSDIISFFAYVSFFPQLVAGPIERASNLLPQFYVNRSMHFEKAVMGMRQIVWGLFKKVVVADNCAIVADSIFANHQEVNGATLFLGAFLFSFQIYGDFSGYSDIAIGSAKLFGIDLMQNFRYPYFSRNIAEFWRRWHISLTTWFRDYVYIPLGGSRCGKVRTFRNTAVIFLLSGFWHGANWTFIGWGIYHALLFVPLMFFGRNRKFLDTVAERRTLPTIREVLQMTTTFALVLIGWIIFRADTIYEAEKYLSGMFSASLFSMPLLIGEENTIALTALFFIAIMLMFEWMFRSKPFVFAGKMSMPGIIAVILFSIWSIYFFGGSNSAFIYFQF